MNTAPIFADPLFGIKTSKINPDYWQKVLDTFDRKEYAKTLIEILNYIDPTVVQKTANATKTAFSIPHGSLIISFSIQEHSYKISVPFLKIPAKNKIALLRQVAEINFNALSLVQIFLRGDELSFEYEAPLELCEPFKVYSTLEEICNNADYYDDLFIEKFGASHIDESKVTKLSPEQQNAAWQQFQDYLNEGLAYYAFFEGKRLTPYCWDVLFLTFTKIDYLLEPQGSMRTEIERSVSSLNADTPLPERLNKAKTTLESWQKMDRSKFETCMYIPEYLIDAKKRADITAIQNYLTKNFDSAKNEIGASNYTGCTLSLLYSIYNIYFRTNIPLDLKAVLNTALKNASGKEWKDAANILFPAVSSIMEIKSGQQPQAVIKAK